MKRFTLLLLFLHCIGVGLALSQSNPMMDAFPKGTLLHSNLPYNNDSLKKHLLDIYLPSNAKGKIP